MHLDGAEQRLRRILEKLSEDFRRKSVTDTHAEVPAASGSWRTCRVGEQQFVATAVISLAVLGHICFDGTSATTNPWSSAGVCQRARV